jgi:alcohol dehydrogenase
MKMACGDRKAAFRAAILDPVLTVSQPPAVTAVTGIDAIAHALESYVCRARNTLSRLFAYRAWQLLEPHFEIVLKQPDDGPARAAMQLGAHFAGHAIENSMLGVCHACSNPLTAHFGLTHGKAIGVMLPHVIRYNASSAADSYAELMRDQGARNGDSANGATRLAARVAGLVRAAGLPTSLSECGVDPSTLPVLAKEAAAQWTARFNPRPVNAADTLQLYRAAT